MKMLQKVSNKFLCELCDYECCKQSLWDKHVLTQKHKMLEKLRQSCDTYNCICGKEYSQVSSLYRHKKQCNYSDNTANINISIDEPPIDEPPIDEYSKINDEKNIIILELLKQNNEFKNMIIDQNEKMMDLVKHASTSITTNNNTTTNNTNFNLNLFLNEKCKNAMNITDFVNNLQIDFNDLENVGHSGYIEGITNIIMKHLNTLDIHTRPIHCTDLKRETLYIKDENEWNKDNVDKTILKGVVRKVADKNLNKLPEWCNENPESYINNTRKNDFYLKIFQNSLGVHSEDEQNKWDEKIIRNISKNVLLEK